MLVLGLETQPSWEENLWFWSTDWPHQSCGGSLPLWFIPLNHIYSLQGFVSSLLSSLSSRVQWTHLNISLSLSFYLKNTSRLWFKQFFELFHTFCNMRTNVFGNKQYLIRMSSHIMVNYLFRISVLKCSLSNILGVPIWHPSVFSRQDG